jgi:hypothetical protein
MRRSFSGSLQRVGKGKREESSSVLKKRTKKLLILQGKAACIGRADQKNKSFLFLFFKKEILPCFAGASVSARAGIKRIGGVHL